MTGKTRLARHLANLILLCKAVGTAKGETTMMWNKEYETIIDLSEYKKYDMYAEYETNATNLEKALKRINGEIELTKFANDSAYKNKTTKALEIVRENICRFIGYEVITIKIDEYNCVTKITNEFRPIDISPIVFPYDENKKYQMQEIELIYAFK